MCALQRSDFERALRGEASLGGTEDVLREFEARVERVERDLRGALERRQQHADAAREARQRIADLTARAGTARDAAATKKLRAQRKRKQAALTDAEQGFATQNAWCEKLHREKLQLEKALAKLVRLRKRARWRRFLGRLRGLRDEDDSGAAANTQIPAPVLALGGVLLVVLVVGVVGVGAFSTDADGAAANPVARLIAWVRGEPEVDPTTSENVTAGRAAAERFGYIRGQAAQAPAPPERPPPPPRLRVRTGGPLTRLNGALWRAALEAPVVYERPGKTWRTPFADLDGDGRAEWLFYDKPGQRILVYAQGRRGGDYAFQRQLLTEPFPQTLHIADINADSAPDLLIPHATRDSPFWYLRNRGDGTFEQRVIGQGQAYWRVATADMNGDGAVDIATAGYRGAWIFRGVGDGDFAPPQRAHDHGKQTFIAVADFNGDGVMDVATADAYSWDTPQATAVVTVALMTSALQPAGPVKRTQVSPAILALAPIDLDGKDGMDLVALRYAGKRKNANGDAVYDVVLLWNSGTGRFDVVECGRTLAGNALVVLDVNHDGREDVLAGNRVFLNTGRALKPHADTLHSGYPWWYQLADIDGDGTQDLVCNTWGARSRCMRSVARPRFDRRN